MINGDNDEEPSDIEFPNKVTQISQNDKKEIKSIQLEFYKKQNDIIDDLDKIKKEIKWMNKLQTVLSNKHNNIQ